METVLLVDDDPALLNIIAIALAKAGLTPVVAQSGEQALALAAQHQFAAALVDKNLQGMDGLDVVRHLRRRQPSCACIVMTGQQSMASAVEALRLGAQDYLAKPSPELDVIGDRVQSAIRKVRLRSDWKELREVIEQQRQQIARLTLELAMSSELTESRAQERVEELSRALAERDRRLAAMAGEILEKARGQRELVEKIEALLALLSQ